MAEDKEQFPEIKEYVKNYVFDKEHQDTYKKLLGAYSVKDRRTDNRLHQKSRIRALADLESMTDDIDAVEHEDHVYKLLGKILHKYDNAKIDIHNKNSKDPDKKKSKRDYDDLHYKLRVKELVDQYLKNNKTTMESLVNDIKEGNVENIVNNILDTEHIIYQQNMTLHKMEEILPPNKSPEFYFKLANVVASKRQQDYTETDLKKMGASRDTFLANIINQDYEISKNNTLKKMKPEKKDAKTV